MRRARPKKGGLGDSREAFARAAEGKVSEADSSRVGDANLNAHRRAYALIPCSSSSHTANIAAGPRRGRRPLQATASSAGSRIARWAGAGVALAKGRSTVEPSREGSWWARSVTLRVDCALA